MGASANVTSATTDSRIVKFVGEAPLKIIHSITGLDVGGAEFMLARFLSRLGHTDVRSTVLSLMRPGVLQGRIRDLGIEVESLGLTQGQLPLWVVPQLGRIF